MNNDQIDAEVRAKFADPALHTIVLGGLAGFAAFCGVIYLVTLLPALPH